MEVLANRELSMRKREIVKKIKEGAVFIYPTDTIYGIGCNANNQGSVDKIREIKQRLNAPFSIIVPNKNWIEENCEISSKNKKELEKLPGPFTLIVKLKNKNVVAPNVNLGKDTIGVRLPNHSFTKFVEEIGIPIVTTSANIAGGHFMTSLENLDSEIEKEVDFMIYEGEKKARPSKIINLVTEEVIER